MTSHSETSDATPQINPRTPQKSHVNPHMARICLCGSTRFRKQYEEANHRLTMAGHLVLSVGTFVGKTGKTNADDAERIEAMLDDIHRRKIDMCNVVIVVSEDGYVGKSTRGEIVYAAENRKRVLFWEDMNKSCDSLASI